MKIPLRFMETNGIERVEEPVSVGVPFPLGMLGDTSVLRLTGRDGERRPLQCTPLARWKDGSIKWVLLDFQVSLEAGTERTLLVSMDGKKDDGEDDPVLNLRDGETHYSVDTGAAVFEVGKETFKPFSRIRVMGEEMLKPGGAFLRLTDESGEKLEPLVSGSRVESSGPMRCTIKVTGRFRGESPDCPLNFTARLSFFRNSPLVRMAFTLENPRPAHHPGGLWDLGDPGSVFFRELCQVIPLDMEEDRGVTGEAEPGKPLGNRKEIFIHQVSSGGENWQSPVHGDREGRVNHPFRGYGVWAEEKMMLSGGRAVPFIRVSGNGREAWATVRHFWQNFPKALVGGAGGILIHLFPEQEGELFELQGGEHKTHTVFMGFADRGAKEGGPGWIHSPLIPRLPVEWYVETRTFDYLVPPREGAVSGLMNHVVEGAHSFFARREIVDEYGWRNFGEFYADHEARGREGEKPFVSHYNNQYDGVMGTLVQFVRSGDERWFFLCDELCRHVRDIDIYHTQGDRPEYNQGLFWHTEHHLPAETATHRCFSKKQKDEAALRGYGGGPSLSHVYATGLLYHYYLTGDPASRDAVMELGGFVSSNLLMARTVSARLMLGVKRARRFMGSRLNGFSGEGFNRVYGPEGPGRAAGNALNTLVDAFAASEERKYLDVAEALIRGAIHPGEDVGKRDLLDVENRWMYTVFLKALGRYLHLKRNLEERDEMFRYGALALLTYADWMVENERTYLENPELLEFPNETWAAQDLRKVCVLIHGAEFAGEERARRYLEKARAIYSAALEQLLGFPTMILTRPLVLMMQNAMMAGTVLEMEELLRRRVGFPESGITARLPWGGLKFMGMISGFSPENELRYLKGRLFTLRKISFKAPHKNA